MSFLTCGGNFSAKLLLLWYTTLRKVDWLLDCWYCYSHRNSTLQILTHDFCYFHRTVFHGGSFCRSNISMILDISGVLGYVSFKICWLDSPWLYSSAKGTACFAATSSLIICWTGDLYFLPFMTSCKIGNFNLLCSLGRQTNLIYECECHVSLMIYSLSWLLLYCANKSWNDQTSALLSKQFK